MRERLVALDDARLEAVLAPRELEALRFGERERVTDVALLHIRDLPRTLPGLFAAAAGGRARRASTASSSTTRTPTPWPRSCPR